MDEPSLSVSTVANPKVTVIIPIHRGARYLVQSVSSVFAQTFSQYEVVVVNDGSPETEQIEGALEPYQKRIKYIKQANQGPSAARNAGIKIAKGEYLAFLDSDDSWYPNYLTEQLSALGSSPALDLIYCDALCIGESGLSGRTMMQCNPPRGEVSFESILRFDTQIITSCTIVRKQLVVEAGMFDERMKCCEDFDLWLRIAGLGARMAYQFQVLGLHRLHPASITANKDLFFQSQVFVFEKLRERIALSPKQLEIVKSQISRAEATGKLCESKAKMMAKKYDEAVVALAQANKFFNSTRLGAVKVGLHVVPGLLRHAYRLRDRWLERGARKRLSLSPTQFPM